MPTPATRKLLERLEPMTHVGRVRAMLDFGKRADEPVLRDLDAGNVFERQLALYSCFSSRDAARVGRGLQDPSKIIRALAVNLAALVLSDDELLPKLRVMAQKSRLTLLHRLKGRDRASGVADRLLTELTASGDTRAVTALLGFASSGLIERHLTTMELASSADLARLARAQPQLTADWLEQQAASQTETNPRLAWQVNATLRGIAQFSADRALHLLRVVRRSTPLNGLALSGLVRDHPGLVASLLLESQDRPGVELSAVAHRLELAQVLALQKQHPTVLQQLEGHLAKFPPEARAPLFQAFRGTWANNEGLISVETLRLLPEAMREAEARRHLEHPTLATRPLQRLPYAGLLGWDEALPLLEAAIKHPKPESRSAAVPALIGTARYNKSQYPRALEWVGSRKNEQDPIRLTMLTALAALPPMSWRSDQLESLGGVLQAALNAADLSQATATAAERIVIRLLPFQPGWAAEWIGRLVKERGQINLYQIGAQISDRQAQTIAASLLPVLRTWETRERESQINNLLFHFGKRLRVLPAFLGVAERLVKSASNAYTSQYSLNLIARHDPERFNRLVVELLKQDQSWATVPVVYQHLSRHRQDLLTPFLGRAAYRGKFSTGKTRFVLPIYSGFHRWTPRQHALFVQTLEEVARDSDRDIPAILRVLVQLPQIPNASAATIERLADLSNSRLAVRDGALRALGRLDEARGLEVLLAALDDSRARVAIYALRRLLLSMPAEAALSLLRRTPLKRVTVAKEVLRLIGELRTEGAHAYLIELSAQPLHRDVRVALLRALWDDLERDDSWAVLNAAAQDQDAAIADGVIRIPADRLSAASQRKLVSLLRTLIAHPDPEVRLETIRRCVWLPVADADKQLLQPLLDAIKSDLPDQTAAAARAFLATYSGTDTVIMGQTFQDLLPNRRALHQAIQAFLERAQFGRQLLEASARAVLEALKADPLTLHLQTRLALSCLPWPEAAAFMIGQTINPDSYHTALTTLGTISQTRSHPALGLELWEQTWGNQENELLRRLALEALIQSASNQYGNGSAWTPAQLERLEAYRADPSGLVAAAAQFTFPNLEL